MKPLVAAILLSLYLPVPLLLIWMHALHPLWRRMGKYSYILHTPLYAVIVFLIFRHKSDWSLHAWGWSPALAFLGAALLLLAMLIALLTYKKMDVPTLLLFRQISPGGGRELVTSGVFGVVRHPRYVMFILLAMGNFFLTGYPLLLAALLFTTALIVIAARLEDKELRSYFGEKYVRYASSTPAFIPRFDNLGVRHTRKDKAK